MRMVKNKELSIDEALDLAEREKWIEEKARIEQEFQVDFQDLPKCSQLNFVVYKYNRYRWQKRILQIDFSTKMIFNIEKGSIRKQFPFSQVKSCAYSEGRRFRISFYGRPDYELEAASVDDKNKITHLLSKVIERNACRELGEPCSGQPETCDVIHEGLLDVKLEMPSSIKWVKHFVQLRERELNLRCIDQLQMEKASPVAKTISLSSGDAVVSKEDGSGAFSLQTKEAKYLKGPEVPVESLRSSKSFWGLQYRRGGQSLISKNHHCRFQIPFTVQNNKLEDISKLQNEWIVLLDRYCSLPEEGSVRKEDVLETANEVVHDLNEEKVEEYPRLPLRSLAVSAAPPRSCSFVSGSVPLPVIMPDMKIPPPSFKSLNQTPRSTRTKAFHWNVVPQEKIQKSLWTSNNLGKKLLDVARLDDQFLIQDGMGFPGNEPLRTQHIMLNQKVAHNFNIFLKSFRIKPSQLKEKLYIIHEDSGGLSDEQITALRRYQPTAKDKEMYLSFKGPPSELHLVDQFMLEMCKIPNLCQILDILHSARELPVSMADLEPLINQKIQACKQLQDCPRFVAVLEYILAIGNYLNEKAGKEKARGFQLSSLAKLPLFRGKERNFTLLHALVEQIFLHEPDLATFPQELTEFKAVSGASIKGLGAEVEVLRKELESVAECRKQIKPKVTKGGTLESRFYKDLKDLIQKYEKDFSQISRNCEDMKKAYRVILDLFWSVAKATLSTCILDCVSCIKQMPLEMMKFGEADDQDSEELFGWISTFISEFGRVLAEIIS